MRKEFPAKVKLAAFERSKGCCDTCGMKIIGRAEFDHDLACWFGGEPTLENCRCLCSKCHRLKTSTADVPRIAKTKRTKAKTVGATRTKHKWPSRPFGKRGMLRAIKEQAVTYRERDAE